jgi:hypothetical protein
MRSLVSQRLGGFRKGRRITVPYSEGPAESGATADRADPYGCLYRYPDLSATTVINGDTTLNIRILRALWTCNAVAERSGLNASAKEI